MAEINGNAVKFLADWQVSETLMRIISDATKSITLVSPFNRHWGHLAREIFDAHDRGVDITIYHHANEANPLAECVGITAVPVQRLSAKIYANEMMSLVCTMNLDYGTAVNAHHAGILVLDPDIRSEIDAYILGLPKFAISEPSVNSRTTYTPFDTPVQQVETPTDIAKIVSVDGFCIECGKPIALDTAKPLCPTCYARHRRIGKHKCCHACGIAATTRVTQPLCMVCQGVDPITERTCPLHGADIRESGWHTANVLPGIFYYCPSQADGSRCSLLIHSELGVLRDAGDSRGQAQHSELEAIYKGAADMENKI